MPIAHATTAFAIVSGHHALAAYRPADTVAHGGRGVSTVFTTISAIVRRADAGGKVLPA
jgi:hypothetical protein